MHVFVSPAPLLRHTYCKTSAPLNATVTGVPLITTAEWGETCRRAQSCCSWRLPSRGMTTLYPLAWTSPWSVLTRTSPVGVYYHMNSVEGRWGETSETRQLTPAGSQMPAAVSARKKWTPRTVSIAAGGLATLNSKACLAGEPPFTPTAGLVCPCTSGVYSMQFEFHERPEKYTGRGED